MHTRKGVVGHIVPLLAELHVVDNAPRCINLRRGRDMHALPLDVRFVKIDQRLIHAHILELEALVNTVDILCVDVAAAAAALDVLNRCLTEQGDFRTLLQRQCVVHIFQKHRTLCRRRTGKLCVRFTSGHSAPVLAERQTGLESKSCIFVHRFSPF